MPTAFTHYVDCFHPSLAHTHLTRWCAWRGQPFYWVLPDEGDCEELFGDKRTSKYVAQDNVQLVHGAELRVYHQQLQGAPSGN